MTVVVVDDDDDDDEDDDDDDDDDDIWGIILCNIDFSDVCLGGIFLRIISPETL